MDFSVFPCRPKKKAEKVAPAQAPATPPPPAPREEAAHADRPPRLMPGFIPQIMQQLPRVPGSRNVEMTFRWNFGDDMDGYHDQQYYGSYYGPASGRMPAAPFRHMAPPLRPPSHQYHMPPGLPPPPFRGMHYQSHTNYGCDPYGPPPLGHYGYHG